jgi:diguanylate cyclase (GGDEF)-like protein/PAS domain S-box-containing protein
MSPKVRQTIADLLRLTAAATGHHRLAIMSDRGSDPIVYPVEGSPAAEPLLRASYPLVDRTRKDPFSLDSQTLFAESGPPDGTLLLQNKTVEAVNLFDSTGQHLGILFALDQSHDTSSIDGQLGLARIARLAEPHLEADAFRNQAVEDLEHSFSINRAILETLYDAVVMTDLKGIIHSVNPAMERMFGYPEKDLIGRPITRLMPPEIAHHHPDYMEAYARGQTPGKIMGNLRSVQAMRADGTRFTLQIAVTETTVGSEHLLVAAMQDITEGEQARLDLTRFRKTLDSTLDCVFMFDAATLNFLYVNQGAMDQLGYSRRELMNMHPYDVKPEFTEKEFRALVRPLVSGEVRRLNFQTVHRHREGHDIPVDVLLQHVTLETDPPRFIAIVRDISEQQKHEKAIEKLAYFDPLTNLPNRQLIRRNLGKSMQTSASSGCYGAVLLTDLDDFKTVNDTLGHRHGDNLLIEISTRFSEVLGNQMSLSRLGGDEFLIVLNTTYSSRKAALQSVMDTARQLLTAAVECTDTLGSGRPVSTSIGIVLYRDATTPASEIMRMADIAMYDAKTKGKNSYSIFDEAMQKKLLEEHSLTVELNAAFSVDDEIIPWFQPKINHRGECIGFEALARWMHPYHGLMSPAGFIELAEKKGLMILLGDRILSHSCRYMSDLRRRFAVDDWTISVNISQSQLAMRDFPEKVESILADTGLPAHALILEITESVIAENIQHSVRQMEQLTAIGVTFSLDDFGTGYSSLSYLRELPIGELKIDQSFVETLLQDEEGYAIVRAILSLARSLKLSVIAEGIEQGEQWQALKDLGCEGFQGYFFGRPQPPGEIIEGLEQGHLKIGP